jgi:glycosyltransferase involved in cell wall biosynthesis
MSKRKILFLSHSAHLNGAEICLYNLVMNLNPDEFLPVVILPSDGPLRQKCIAAKIKTYIFPFEWWVRFRSDYFMATAPLAQRVEEILQIVDAEHPDVIHTNTSVILEGALAARARGIPHVWHLHEILDGHPDLQPLLTLTESYKVIGCLGHRVVVVSNSFYNRYLEGIPSSRRTVIYNGIEVPMPAPDGRERIRQAFGLLQGELLSLSVGSLTRYKDHGNLVKAAELVARSECKIKFVVAGGGNDSRLKTLEGQVQEAGLSGRVQFLGHRDDVPDLLAACDLFVLPSRREAFPLAVLEAMALGKPVIATDCGGTREMIHDGREGFVVPPGNPEALAEKILELLSIPDGLGQFGQRAMETFRQRFTVSNYVHQFEKLYDVVSAEGCWGIYANRWVRNWKTH